MLLTSAEASWPWNPTMRRCPALRTLSRMAPSSAPEPLAHRVADLAAVRRLALRREGVHGRREVLLDPIDERNGLGHRPRISRFRAILPVELGVLAPAYSSCSPAPEVDSVAAARKPPLRAGGLRALAKASRIAAVLLALAAIAAPADAAAPLARLADALAGEIVAAVHGSAVEVASPEDRTGSGGSLALDLASLLRARLEGRVRLVSSGPRIRVGSVLAEGPGRLWVSARLTEEPGGRLVDVLAASAEADPMLLSLVPAGPAGGAGLLAVVAFRRTPLVEGRVLDVAPMGEDRVLVLYEDALALYRLDDAGLALLSRHALPVSLPVRFPGGTIYVASGEGAAWVLTSRSPRAVLFGLDNGRLEDRQQAEALFWPRTPRGLRYRPGTNLLEGSVADLGDGPFLRLDPRGTALTPDGRLWMASSEGPRAVDVRAGGGLARPAPELIAVAGGDPPGPRDVVLLLDARDPGRPPLQSLPGDGAVRALGARGTAARMRLVAAVEEERGTHLVLMHLAALAP